MSVDNHLVVIRNQKTHRKIKTLTNKNTLSKYSASSIAITPDGKTLASGNKKGDINVYKFHTFKLITTFSGHTNEVVCLCFNHAGKILASAGYNKTLIVWSLDTMQ